MNRLYYVFFFLFLTACNSDCFYEHRIKLFVGYAVRGGGFSTSVTVMNKERIATGLSLQRALGKEVHFFLSCSDDEEYKSVGSAKIEEIFEKGVASKEISLPAGVEVGTACKLKVTVKLEGKKITEEHVFTVVDSIQGLPSVIPVGEKITIEVLAKDGSYYEGGLRMSLAACESFRLVQNQVVVSGNKKTAGYKLIKADEHVSVSRSIKGGELSVRFYVIRVGVGENVQSSCQLSVTTENGESETAKVVLKRSKFSINDMRIVQGRLEVDVQEKITGIGIKDITLTLHDSKDTPVIFANPMSIADKRIVFRVPSGTELDTTDKITLWLRIATNLVYFEKKYEQEQDQDQDQEQENENEGAA